MQIAGCTWGLRRDQAAAADAFDRAGFDTIDVDPGFGPAAGWESPRPVSCLAAGHLFPGGTRLDDASPEDRATARRHVLAAIEEAARLGAEVVYVGAPNPDEQAMSWFADCVPELAAHSTRRGLLLAVEPSPPRGLRTIGETRSFIESLGVDNFHILLDFAHCLLVDEDPVAAIEGCGERLAYVHFNDTDGVNDNHLGLTDGIFDRRLVEEIVAELGRVGYSAPAGGRERAGPSGPAGQRAKDSRGPKVLRGLNRAASPDRPVAASPRW